MYNKLKFIKMFIATILMSLTLISIMKSCCYAWTFDDFITFIRNTQNQQTNTNLKNQGTFLLNNLTMITNYLNQQNIDLNQYDSFVLLDTQNNTNKVKLYLIKTNTNSSYSINSSSQIVVSNYGTIQYYQRYEDSYGQKINSIQTESWNNATKVRPWGLMSTSPTNNNFYSAIMQNYYSWVNGIEHPNNPEDPLPLLIGQAQTGSSITPTNVTFKLLNLENNEINFNYQINYESDSQGGNIYSIFLINGENVTNGNNYILEMYNSNTKIATSEAFQIIWGENNNNNNENSNGTITNQSGDTSTIDYSPITNRLDNIEQILASGDQKAEERQSFWEKAYNTMFIPSGDYLDNKIQELKETLNISGDYSGEVLILEQIKNNSGDFIISWNTMSTHFSTNGVQNEKQLIIPSGEINFSQIERENESFQITMKWVRVLLGFSLIVIIIKQAWTLLLKTLGLSTEVYEQHREEQERLTKAQEQETKRNNARIRQQIFNANQERLREYNKLAKKMGWGKK